jgi:tetratricopeptide (TPR) repeat protein
LTALALSAFGALADSPILPPDAAARLFQQGRDEVMKGDFAKGIEHLEKALATGYAKPQERLGTGRFFVDRYDPDYWLGVAYMQRGDEAKARQHLLRSKEGELIEKWPEFSDLNARLATLDEREAARRLARLPPPTPIPTATPAPILPPAATIEAPPSAVGTVAPLPTATPDSDRPVPLTDSADALAAVGALSKGDLARAEQALARLEAKEPRTLEGDLLTAVVLSSRYLLEGRTDDALLARAKTSLAAYRRRGGSRRAEESWISPALSAVLGF